VSVRSNGGDTRARDFSIGTFKARAIFGGENIALSCGEMYLSQTLGDLETARKKSTVVAQRKETQRWLSLAPVRPHWPLEKLDRIDLKHVCEFFQHVNCRGVFFSFKHSDIVAIDAPHDRQAPPATAPLSDAVDVGSSQRPPAMPCGEIAAIPNILPPSKLVNRHRRTPDKHRPDGGWVGPPAPEKGLDRVAAGFLT